MKNIIMSVVLTMASFGVLGAECSTSKHLNGQWKFYFNARNSPASHLLCDVNMVNGRITGGVCGHTQVSSGRFSVNRGCYMTGKLSGREVYGLIPDGNKNMFSGISWTARAGHGFVRAVKVQHTH